MGTVFALSGPSGVGKTTFLSELIRTVDVHKLTLLPRYTDRPSRPDEEEGFEYLFTSHQGLLQKVFANDFIHLEKWGHFYSAIETRVIKETIDSPRDGIVLASTFGAARLKASYGEKIVSLYLWSGEQPSLLNPRCLDASAPEIQELKWRIGKKLNEDGFSDFEVDAEDSLGFVDKRMVDNYLDIAAVNGRLRSGDNIRVIPNLHGQVDDAVKYFERIWQASQQSREPEIELDRSGCFVLMPFGDTFRPIYDDHIKKVCEELGLPVRRADQIFSTRPVMDDLLDAVKTARVVIADLTANNPNVLYEVGVCHALGKDVVLLTQETTAPFDLSQHRRIHYSYTPPGMSRFEEALRGTLAALLKRH